VHPEKFLRIGPGGKYKKPVPDSNFRGQQQHRWKVDRNAQQSRGGMAVVSYLDGGGRRRPGGKVALTRTDRAICWATDGRTDERIQDDCAGGTQATAAVRQMRS